MPASPNAFSIPCPPSPESESLVYNVCILFTYTHVFICANCSGNIHVMMSKSSLGFDPVGLFHLHVHVVTSPSPANNIIHAWLRGLCSNLEVYCSSSCKLLTKVHVCGLTQVYVTYVYVSVHEESWPTPPSPDEVKLKPQHHLEQVKDCLFAIQQNQGEILSHLRRGSYPKAQDKVEVAEASPTIRYDYDDAHSVCVVYTIRTPRCLRTHSQHKS